jgi:hypothetical protein
LREQALRIADHYERLVHRLEALRRPCAREVDDGESPTPLKVEAKG